MSAKKGPREPELVFHAEGSGRGVYKAIWPVHHNRFLLSDGTTIDTLSTADNSDLRAAVLRVTGAERIEGSTLIIGADWGDGSGTRQPQGSSGDATQPRHGDEGDEDLEPPQEQG